MHRFDGYDIELTRGDTLFFTLNLTGRDLPEGSVAYFTVKSGPRSGEVLIEKKLDAGNEKLDIRLTSEDTDLPPRTYYWDVRVLIPLAEGGYEVETPMEYAAFTILEAIGSAGDDEQTSGMDADLPVLSLLVKEARSLLDELRTAAESGAFQGETGPEGPQGVPGADGVSPIVSCAAIPGGGYRLTIRDAEGPKVVEVWDGKDLSSNIMNGAAYGSLRTVVSAPEDDEYALGYGAFALGDQTKASGRFAMARGVKTQASGYNAYAEGIETVSSGANAHAEGSTTTASATCSHAEGMTTTASGTNSHAEGSSSLAKGSASHAEGTKTQAIGGNSHAEGNGCIASGSTSHAEGRVTLASGMDQHVQGKWNIEDTENRYAHIVGNGTSAGSRSNAHTIDWNGNAWFQGDVYVYGKGQDEGVRLMRSDEVPEHTVSKEYVDEQLAQAVSDAISNSVSDMVSDAVSEAVAEVRPSSPDWNENDDTRVTHVKNRTHWLDWTPQELLKDVDLILDAESSMYIIPQPFTLVPGHMHTVTWNGVQYECMCELYQEDEVSMPAIGNMGAMTGGEVTEVPFIIAQAPEEFTQEGMYGMAIPLDYAESVVLSITGVAEAPHELDAKFIKTALANATQGFVKLQNSDALTGPFTTIVSYIGNDQDGKPLFWGTPVTGVLEEAFHIPGQDGFLTYTDNAYRRIENAFTFDGPGYALSGIVLKSSGGKRFKITVDDSGTLAATAVE